MRNAFNGCFDAKLSADGRRYEHPVAPDGWWQVPCSCAARRVVPWCADAGRFDREPVSEFKPPLEAPYGMEFGNARDDCRLAILMTCMRLPLTVRP